MRHPWIMLALAPWLLSVAYAQQGRPGQAPAPRPPAATPAAPPAEAPDRTTAQFGDWTMRCETSRAGGAAQRGCELVQVLQDARGQPVAQIVIGRLGRAERWRMLVHLPLEARVEQPARVFAEASDGEAVALPFRLCAVSRGGCLADLELPDDAMLRRFTQRGEAQGRIEFNDPSGRQLQAMFGLRGFGAALDALIRSE